MNLAQRQDEFQIMPSTQMEEVELARQSSQFAIAIAR